MATFIFNNGGASGVPRNTPIGNAVKKAIQYAAYPDLKNQPCSLCGSPHYTLCDVCTRTVCYDCISEDVDGIVCVECAIGRTS